MGKIINLFKSLYDWVSDKMKNNGIKHTIISILATGFILLMLGIYNNTLQHNIQEILYDHNTEQVEYHQQQYLASRDMYSSVKQILKAQRPVIGADYILFLEYHNGSENIATGYQFCKFDVTIEVLSDSVPYIVIDDFRDENLYKYDILLSDQVAKSKISSFSLEEIHSIDRNLHYMLNPNEHTQYIVFYNLEYRGMVAGTLMFMFKDKDIDYRSVTNCAHDVETLINNSISRHEREMIDLKTKKLKRKK